jgi:asparagine synthase (glutamine-hydrolysing)
MPGSRTVYRGVAKLEAASWVELGPGGEELGGGRYWRFDPRPEPISAADAEERVEEELGRALAMRLRSDVPVGLFLSGGLDSSLLAATWRKLHPEGVLRTFTVGFDEPSYDERASARRVADAVGSEHHEIVASGAELERELDWIWDRLSEPFADPSIVPTSMVCRFARRTVKVALGGDGADELQAGYDPFRAWRAARRMESVLPRRLWHLGLKAVERLLPTSPANLSARFKARHFAQGFLHPPEERIQGWMASFPPRDALAALKPELAAEIEAEEVLEPTRRAFREARRHGELQAQIAVWVATYLESSILTKLDRAGMMCSLEVRSPFLDPRLAATLASLPPELIYRGGRGKALLRRLAARLLPPEVLAKPKKGLGVPQATWLRTWLSDRVEEGIAKSRTGGWFDADAIERLWRAHRSGRADYRRALWNFVFSFPFQR